MRVGKADAGKPGFRSSVGWESESAWSSSSTPPSCVGHGPIASFQSLPSLVEKKSVPFTFVSWAGYEPDFPG